MTGHNGNIELLQEMGEFAPTQGLVRRIIESYGYDRIAEFHISLRIWRRDQQV